MIADQLGMMILDLSINLLPKKNYENNEAGLPFGFRTDCYPRSHRLLEP